MGAWNLNTFHFGGDYTPLAHHLRFGDWILRDKYTIPMDPFMKIFISSSRFLCNARISSRLIVAALLGPKKTDMGSYRWKATPPESCEKMKIYVVEPEIFLVWPPFSENSTHPTKKTRSSAEKSAIIGIMARPLGAEKQQPLLVFRDDPQRQRQRRKSFAKVGF